MVVLLSMISLGVILLIMLGRWIQPYSKRKPIYQWSLNDYGGHMVRGLSVFWAAGERSTYRMDRLHEEAGRDPKREPEGLGIVDAPYLDDPDDPRGKLDPPRPRDEDPDVDPDHPQRPSA